MKYQRKYEWVAVAFAEELRRIQKQVLREHGLSLSKADISLKLAHDLKTDQITLDLTPVKFKKQNIMDLGGGLNIKLKKQR